jgi:hypothetical protein
MQISNNFGCRFTEFWMRKAKYIKMNIFAQQITSKQTSGLLTGISHITYDCMT